MFSFYLFTVVVCLVGILGWYFLLKNPPESTIANQPTGTPSEYDIWWKNLKHTPLSEYESKQIAERIAELYMEWKSNPLMDHSWLCLGIERSSVLFKQIYHPTGEVKFAPQPTISYSHTISCQNDRILLASYILSAVKAKDPGCKLFLDGDSLILPTNSK